MMLTLEIIQGLGFRGSLESLRAFQLGLTTSILTVNMFRIWFCKFRARASRCTKPVGRRRKNLILVYIAFYRIKVIVRHAHSAKEHFRPCRWALTKIEPSFEGKVWKDFQSDKRRNKPYEALPFFPYDVVSATSSTTRRPEP